MFMIDSTLRRFESSQCDQHRLRQLFSTGLLEHVDDLRRSVLSVRADMEQYIATTGSVWEPPCCFNPCCFG